MFALAGMFFPVPLKSAFGGLRLEFSPFGLVDSILLLGSERTRCYQL